MRFGVALPQREMALDLDVLLRYVWALEEKGFSFIQCVDHVLGVDWDAHPDKSSAHDYDIYTPLHEQFTLFAYLAGRSNLEFATGILVLPQRQTALVAKQAAEVDILSGGRLRLGVGTGWNQPEYEGLGASFDDRGARFEEQIQVLRMLWTEEAVTFKGRFHQIHGAGILPRPTHSIPIWIGGGAGPSRGVLERIARLADGWQVGDSASEEVASKLKFINEAARVAGREAPMGLSLVNRHAGRDLGDLRRELDAAQALGATYLTMQPTAPCDTQQASIDWYFDHLDFVAGVITEYRD
ncbi:MAG TPA: LLM class F420-dependent oxidoreductase [Acidimicrobiales bacterium]|jgi:probable F420-dependent oxidoreductase|nr:LLM class F420-dependent oxidoreductase [Acidimicrobiales bacterium]